MRLLGTTMALVFAVACNGGLNGDDTGENPDGGNGLPDPGEGMAFLDRCEGFTDDQGNFTPVAGATVYWLGNFTLHESGDVSGVERIEIFPNERWKEVNPDHAIRCKVVWDVSGVWSEDGTCATCDYRLTMDAFKNEEASTCHPTFTSDAYDDQMLNIQYDVRNVCTGDGPCEATLTFPSGNAIGSGQSNDRGVTYAADGQCAFY